MHDLRVEEAGSRDGDPIVLLHGFLSCNAQWQLNRWRLGGGHRLLMTELWGHGGSPLPASNEAYSPDGYAAALEAILDSCGIERAHLIGQSFGAGVMLHFALSHPSRVRRVVVTNSRSAFDVPLPSSRAALPARDAEFDARSLPFHPIHARRFPPAVKANLVAAADSVPLEAVLMGGHAARFSFRDRLADLRAPLMVANGIHEKGFQRVACWLREEHAHVHVVDLPGGHSVNLEAAEAFDTEVLRFFSETSGV